MRAQHRVHAALSVLLKQDEFKHVSNCGLDGLADVSIRHGRLCIPFDIAYRVGFFFDARELVTNIRSNIFDVVDTIVFQINARLCDENSLSLSGLIIGGNLGKHRDCLGLFGVSIDVIGYPFTCPPVKTR
jgi:hypothetical protein